MDRVLGLLTLLFALLARHSLLVLAVRLVERELDGFEVVPDLLMDVPENLTYPWPQPLPQRIVAKADCLRSERTDSGMANT